MIELHRIPSPSMVPYAAAALSLLLGCEPPPKSIGDGMLGADDDPTTSNGSAGEPIGEPSGTDDGNTGQGPGESSGAGSDESSTGEPLDPDAPLWSYVVPDYSFVFTVDGMPDGGVVTLELHYDHPLEVGPYVPMVVRYSPEGDVLWQNDLESPSLRSIDTLPDGRIFVGGTNGDGFATVWQLSSAGAIEETYSHPGTGDVEAGGGILGIMATGTGVAYTLQDLGTEPPSHALWWADLDLVPQWSSVLLDTAAVAVLPSGDIVTIELQDIQTGDLLMRTFTADGTPTGAQVVPGGGFAGDDPLVRIESGEGSTRLVGMFGTSALDVVLPFRTATVSHDSNGGITVAATNESGQPGSGTTIVQLDASGTELRSVPIPSLGTGSANATDVFVAPDGSAYLSGFEYDFSPTDAPSSSRGFLIKLPPA
jgi:hypothetical protein